jgi:hypothetical protein
VAHPGQLSDLGGEVPVETLRIGAGDGQPVGQATAVVSIRDLVGHLRLAAAVT